MESSLNSTIEVISDIISSSQQTQQTQQNTIISNSENKILNINEQFTILGYLLGLLFLLSINLGPYCYYKFVKNKKIFKSAGIEPKHTI